MNNSKLITVLSSLTKGEWLSFKKHVLANTSKESDVFTIFDFLYNSKDRLSSIEEVEPIVKKHFKHLTVKVFLNHMSTLFQWLETWLVMQEIAHEKYTFDLTLLKALNRRGHYNLANQVHQKLEKKINDNDAWDTEKSKAKATMLHYQHYSNNPIKYEKGASLFQELIDSYTVWVREQFLLYKVEMHSWGRIQKHDFTCEIKTVNKLASILKRSPLSQAFELLNAIYEDDNIESFMKLFNALLDSQFEVHSESHTIVNLCLIQRFLNFRQKGIKMDDNNTIITKLYDHGLSHGVFSEYGKLASVTFRNIINTLAVIETYEAMEMFILKWAHLANAKDAMSIANIAHAINCFHHEKYDRIPILTRSLEYNGLDEKILVLSLNTIAAFFNRDNEYDFFQHSIDNFGLLLKRNKAKISEKHFKAFKNLIHFIKLLDKTEYKKTINLADYDFLFYRSWCEKMLATRKAALKN